MATGLTPATVDVFLSTLDQLAPNADKPIGRLLSSVNTSVKRYQNPRAADGTVTHVEVGKRDGFSTLSNIVRSTSGSEQGTLTGTAQVFYGGGDALRLVSGNRLYTFGESWVQAYDPTATPSIVLPQTVRSASVYAADSQAEAPDIAIGVDDVACIVWREVAQQATSNITGGSTSASSLDGVRVMFRKGATGAVVRPAFTRDPRGGGTNYLKARTVFSDGVFWVLQDSVQGGGVQIDVTVFDQNGEHIADTSLPTVSNNQHWDVVAVSSYGIWIAMPNNGSGVKFTQLRFSGSIDVTTHVDTTITTTTSSMCAWLVDSNNNAGTGWLVVSSGSGSAGTLTAYRIGAALAQNHVYPTITNTIDLTNTWLSGVAGYVNPSNFNLTVAWTVMDLFGKPEWEDYGSAWIGSSGTSWTNIVASDQYPDQGNNTTYTALVPFSGSATAIATRYSMSLATRAFSVAGDWFAWGYYPARKWGPLPRSGTTADRDAPSHCPHRPADPSNFQPCWYLLPLDSTQQIAGRLEHGLASADFQVIAANTGSLHPGVAGTPGPRNRCLGSVPTILATGAPCFALGTRVEQNLPSTSLVTQTVVLNTNTYTNQTLIYASADTVGVKTFTIGPDCGQAFTVNQTTYLPGVMTSIVEPGDTNVSEHGIVAPECPWVVLDPIDSVTPAGFGAFFYSMVAEYTTARGKVYRSLPSAAFSFKSIEIDNYCHFVCNQYLHPTNKKGVKLSIYRNAFTEATISSTAQVTEPPTFPTDPATNTINAFTTVKYKVTSDLTPFYNDPTKRRFVSGTISAPDTAPFVDSPGVATQATGEVLYTDQGMLPRFPAPASRGGCVWQNRAWLIGYDNALWFSGEINEQDGEWFFPGFRVFVPTTEEVTAIASLDQFLIIFTEKSVWYLPESALPDSTGANGSIPTPIRLPFEMGCTGFTGVIRDGVAYSSSAGGVWMITRALGNTWIGQSAKDELSVPITGIQVVENSLCVSTATGAPWKVMVFDMNLGGWSTWTFQADGAIAPIQIAANDNALAWTDDGRVFVQKPDTYFDVDSNPGGQSIYVSSTAKIAPVHIGGVKSQKRTWALQLQGQVYDPCDLNVSLVYGDDENAPSVAYKPIPVVPGLLDEEIRPTKQLASSIGLTIFDSQNESTSAGRGFSLSVVGFIVGLEPPGSRTAPSKRAKAA